ncbi:MAG: glutathione S-transferase family protein, partial [Caulobacterales bacterium]
RRMTYILHHMTNSRSTRVLWLMEEMGLDYELRVYKRADLKTPEYMALSPLGSVPALEYDGGVMLESGAIVQFLLARHAPSPLDVGKDQPNFADYLQWLHFGEASLATWVTNYLRNTRVKPEPERNIAAAEESLARIKPMFEFMGSVLNTRKHIAGETFTAADIMVGYTLYLARIAKLLDDAPPSLRDYYERVSSRPAFGRAKSS